jgi:3-deoxy-D-manno-octulosonic acid kinase
METKASTIESKQYKNKHFLFNTAFFSGASSDLFCSTSWKDKGSITGQEIGRGTTWFLRHDSHDLVLRHYLRGGLVSKISQDNYVFKGLQSCRSISEFNILYQLSALGLPVPIPAAAQVIQQGITYKADLLTQRIPNAQDLVQVLKVAQDKIFYQALGQTIALFHQHGVYHADLNIQNILQDKNNKFWLIDFDRAKRLKPKPKWQLSNLSRLKRSFEKEKIRFGIKWKKSDWDVLIAAYQKAMP